MKHTCAPYDGPYRHCDVSMAVITATGPLPLASTSFQGCAEVPAAKQGKTGLA